MLPSPIVFDISAEPPAPNIKPNAPSIIINGYMKLSAANSVSPAKFETKKPSTTPYIEENTIIIILGIVNLISFL